MNFDSKEEEYFYWWLMELADRKLIYNIKYQPKSFQLYDGHTVSYLERMKTKTKEKSIALLSGHKYTADFYFVWSNKLKNILFGSFEKPGEQNINKLPFKANYSSATDYYFSVVDVKGTFNQNNMWREFSINQKWVFQKYGIYVQKIVPHPQITEKGKMVPKSALFPNTFIPRRFTMTDGGKQLRKLRYDYSYLTDFLKNNGL